MSRASVIRWSAILVFAMVWELVRQFDLVNAILLASPSEIYSAISKDGGAFIGAFQVTLAEIVAAIIITWSLGLTFGLLAGTIPVLGMAAGPVMASLFAIPLIVWYPLFMVWLGIGPASKILFAVVSGFFPIALNTMNGVRLLDRRYILLGQSMGATKFQLLFRILMPLALPSVMSGLRIGTALVVIGVIVTEMLASVQGLGFWISYHRTLFNTGHVYLGMLLALACALIVNWGLSKLEIKFGRWRELEKTDG